MSYSKKIHIEALGRHLEECPHEFSCNTVFHHFKKLFGEDVGERADSINFALATEYLTGLGLVRYTVGTGTPFNHIGVDAAIDNARGRELLSKIFTVEELASILENSEGYRLDYTYALHLRIKFINWAIKKLEEELKV